MLTRLLTALISCAMVLFPTIPDSAIAKKGNGLYLTVTGQTTTPWSSSLG